MRNIYLFSILACMSSIIACSPAKGDRTGHEFMPDMVHATGYEANLYNYYYYNRWGTEAEYKSYVMPRHSVPGTVARGHISVAGAADPGARMHILTGFSGEGDGGVAISPNGSVPYPYLDTEEERSRAMREITQNPFPITADGLAKGKELYMIYCGICHGEKGDGFGFLVREEDPAKGIVAGVYPAAPANFLLDTFVDASVGRLYHSIMYGKNVMGSYADKLSYKERWDVIHFIRSLQAQAAKSEYSPSANTFNREATPWAAVEASMKKVQPTTEVRDTTSHPVGSEGQQHMNQH